MSVPLEILDEREAAAFLRLSSRTLQRMRLDGGGPAYVQLGERRIAYRIASLRDWLANRESRSTSQGAA